MKIFEKKDVLYYQSINKCNITYSSICAEDRGLS